MGKSERSAPFVLIMDGDGAHTWNELRVRLTDTRAKFIVGISLLRRADG